MTPEAEIIPTQVEHIIAQHVWAKLAEILRLPKLALPAGAISVKNVHTQCMRRRWWEALKQNEPIHAKKYATAMNKSFAELDKYYGVSS